MAEEQQLRLDLEELRHLESVAKRPRVLSLLSSEIHIVDAKLASIRAVAAKPVVSNDQASVTATAAALNYVTLGSFSWDQDNEKIKASLSKSKMSRMDGNVYRRRGTLEKRAMNLENDATDGTKGEIRREIPVVAEPSNSSINATMESFTQMMAAMTQMIKNTQTQAGGSGSTLMDKNLKLFQDMNPPMFSSGGPIEAEDWLIRIEKILEGMSCPEDRRVTLAAFAFEGEAEIWWRSQLQETFGGRLSSQVSWGEFLKVFRDWYVPMSVRRQMQDEFIRLVQGDRTITQYEAEFTRLFRYASHLIPNAEEKCYHFLSGLNDIIRQPLISFGIEDYSTLVKRARKIELDLQATQKRRDQHKRKIFEEDIQSNQTEGSNRKKSKFNSNGGNGAIVSKVTESYAKCGRLHKGECLIGSKTCYWCHQHGHIVKYCPDLAQKTSKRNEIK